MQGVLIVAHGSRIKETEKTLMAILNMVGEKLPGICLEHAFMEFSDQTLEKGIRSLIDKNVTEIKVVPYFLFTGVHLKEDIPRMIQECMAGMTPIKVVMGEPLGIDSRLADILIDRIMGKET